MKLILNKQGELTRLQKKELRSRSQQLGKALVTIQIGKNGVTQNTLVDVFNALYKNELIKVHSCRVTVLSSYPMHTYSLERRELLQSSQTCSNSLHSFPPLPCIPLKQLKLGGGCEDTLDEVVESITTGCDAVLVHSIGFTALIYRAKGLPRISPTLGGAIEEPDFGLQDDEEDDEEEEEEEAPAVEVRRQTAAAASSSEPSSPRKLAAAAAVGAAAGGEEEQESESELTEEEAEAAQLLGDEEDDDFIDAEVRERRRISPQFKTTLFVTWTLCTPFIHNLYLIIPFFFVINERF